MFNFPIPALPSNLPNETPKPRKTGAWLKQYINAGPMVWTYTAKPEFYRQSPTDVQYFPFHQNPPNIAP